MFQNLPGTIWGVFNVYLVLSERLYIVLECSVLYFKLRQINVELGWGNNTRGLTIARHIDEQIEKWHSSLLLPVITSQILASAPNTQREATSILEDICQV